MVTIVRGDPRFNIVRIEGRGSGAGLSVEGTDRVPFKAGLFQDVTDVQWGGGGTFCACGYATFKAKHGFSFLFDNTLQFGYSVDGLHWAPYTGFTFNSGQDSVGIGTGALPGGGLGHGTIGMGATVINGVCFMAASNTYQDDDGDTYNHAVLAASVNQGRSWSFITDPNQYYVHDAGKEPHLGNVPMLSIGVDATTGHLYCQTVEYGQPPSQYRPNLQDPNAHNQYFLYGTSGGPLGVIRSIDGRVNRQPNGFVLSSGSKFANFGALGFGTNMSAPNGRPTTCTVGETMKTVALATQKPVTVTFNVTDNTVTINGVRNGNLPSGFAVMSACCGKGVILVSGQWHLPSTTPGAFFASIDGGISWKQILHEFTADNGGNNTFGLTVAFG